MRKAKEWSIRAVHEAQLHTENCFVTLTYDDDHLPSDNSVSVRDFQLFMKRLRKELAYCDRKVRYLACGEYGERNGRPHYHLLLFGFCPSDLVDFSGFGVGHVYTSMLLSRLWPFGFHSVGSVTEQSAAYVARYTVKKAKTLNGVREDGRTPEFIVSSRRPGLGAGWFEKYWSDVYSYDVVVGKGGVKSRPPKYYDRLLEKKDMKLFERIKAERRLIASQSDVDLSTLHIATLEEIMALRCKALPRRLEERMNK